MEDRIALAREADGEDLADAINDWGNLTPANRLRWHQVVIEALAPEGELVVSDVRALMVDDLAPLDPSDEDPAVYIGTVRLDATLEQPGEDGDIDDFDDASIAVAITATIGRSPEGDVEVLVHDLATSELGDDVDPAG
jgi:hypothetical protein